MKKSVLTISVLFLLSAGSVFAADETPNTVPQQADGSMSACKKMQDGGHKHSQKNDQQPATDEKASQAVQPAQQHVH